MKRTPLRLNAFHAECTDSRRHSSRGTRFLRAAKIKGTVPLNKGTVPFILAVFRQVGVREGAASAFGPGSSDRRRRRPLPPRSLAARPCCGPPPRSLARLSTSCRYALAAPESAPHRPRAPVDETRRD